jgi:predicted metalloprotease with PDZ domain
MMEIQLSLDFHNPSEKYLHVDFEIQLPKSGLNRDLVMTMPNWTPGSYLVRDFATHVEAFQAFDGKGRPLTYQKIKKNQWEVHQESARTVRVSYKIYANDLSVRAAYMDHEFAFANGPAVFMHPEGFLKSKITLKLKTPKGWDVALGKKPERGVYVYDHFDILYDTPILTANTLERRQFKVGKTTYHIATVGPHRADLDRIATDMKTVLTRQLAIFGDNPCDEYLFQILFVKGGYGGLEHLYSSSNIFDGLSLDDPKRYPILISLLAHEHFHLWNVKRIRPRALGPFDYHTENYTRELWIAEGVTSYYDDHTTYRGGIYSREAYLNVIAENIVKYEAGKGARLNSLSEASFDAWIRYYRQNENSPNTSVNYYLKGGLVMMLLDFEIIRKSKGKHTLDDVMKDQYELFKKRPELGITREEFFASVEKFTGASTQKFIKDHIDGTAVIDWDKAFAPFGLSLEVAKPETGYYLGVTSREANGKVFIDKIAEDSPAFHSPMQSGDEILAVNNERIESARQLKSVLGKPRVKVLFARRGVVYEERIALTKHNPFNKKLQVQKNLTLTQKKDLESFLRR